MNSHVFREKLFSTRKRSIVYCVGLKQFYQHLYGCQFTLYTDHKCVIAILSPKHGITSIAAAQLQWCSLLLSLYSYSMKFKLTVAYANANCLSRPPLQKKTTQLSSNADIFVIMQIEALPLIVAELQTATRNNALLSKFYTTSMKADLPQCRNFCDHTSLVITNFL